jgi:endoglucanase
MPRALWTAYCARFFESFGFSWHYWEFCSGFGIYNPKTRRFYKELVEALLSTDATLLELGEPAQGNGPEILRNGDFSASKAHWTFGAWRTPAQATAEVVDGELVEEVQKTGHEPWHIQLIQSGLTLENGCSYLLSFEARADRNRTISTSIDGDAQTNYASFGENTVAITPELQTYSLLVHINESINTGRVVFSFAQDNGLVYLDQISLRKYQ